MNAIKGTFKNGQIVLNEPANWPEGTQVLIEPVPGPGANGMTEVEQGDDPESLARWLRWYDSLEPLLMTPEEEADWKAWRQKVKEYTIATMNKDVEGLFP
jgi:hypothetical protein